MKMLRICTTSMKTDFKQDPEKGFYSISGPRSTLYKSFVQLTNQMFSRNNSFYLTTETEECVTRLANNESDFTTAMFPYFESHKVLIPMFANKINFITGYQLNHTSLKPKECGNVMANVELLGPFVYVATLALVLWAMLIMLFQI